jgi:hypothetical protein
VQINTRPDDPFGPPRIAHQVDTVQVNVEMRPEGLRVSTPSARGWAAVVRNRAQLAQAVLEAFTEAQVAAYAAAHGEEYDLSALTAAVPNDPMAPPVSRPGARSQPGVGWSRGQRRPDTHDPAQWSKQPDGAWRSPGGVAYGATSQMARRIVARRNRLGLPT